MKRLKFPDGYATGLKRCVNVKARKIHGLKLNSAALNFRRLQNDDRRK
jgi:hypothetical protein